MSPLIRICSFACLVAMVGFAQVVGSAAAESTNALPEGPAPRSAEASAAEGQPTKLVWTKNFKGDKGSLAIPGGAYRKFMQKGINCKSNNCRVEAIMSIQLINNSSTFAYAICLGLDNVVPSGCATIGLGPFNQYFMPLVLDSIDGIGNGKHKVGVYIYPASAVEASKFNITFNLYSK